MRDIRRHGGLSGLGQFDFETPEYSYTDTWDYGPGNDPNIGPIAITNPGSDFSDWGPGNDPNIGPVSVAPVWDGISVPDLLKVYRTATGALVQYRAINTPSGTQYVPRPAGGGVSPMTLALIAAGVYILLT